MSFLVAFGKAVRFTFLLLEAPCTTVKAGG